MRSKYYEAPYAVSRGQTPIIFTAGVGGPIQNVFHSLPLSSRSAEEVLEDHATEIAFRASEARSLIRRAPKRFELQSVVDSLDELSDTTDKIAGRFSDVMGSFVLNALQKMESPERPAASKSDS